MNTPYPLGSIVSWQEPDVKQRTIAVIADTPDTFQVAIHHKGDSNVNTEGFEIWFSDSIPDNAQDIRPATKDETLEIVWSLVEHGEPFSMTANRHILLPDYDSDNATTPELQKWHGYLAQLVNWYARKHTLRGASVLRKEYHVGGLTKELFFQLGLDKKRMEDIDIRLTCKVVRLVKNQK